MHKELHSIEMIRSYLESKGIINTEISNIDQIYKFFSYLSDPESSKKFNSLYILNYLNQYLVSPDVAKRKTSARIFEDLLAIIFKGVVTDGEERKNISSAVPEYFNLARDKIAGNKREKIDILFNERRYGISVKTLIQSNTEINLGSFEKNVLFDGFDVSEYLTERKTSSDVGLGSEARLRRLLLIIQEKRHYDKFAERFEKMFNFIFQDDMVLAIKDTTRLEIYFFDQNEFANYIANLAPDIELLLTVVNRWEGNSIRIDRKKIIENCSRKVILDLSVLDKTVVKLLNELDYKLHEAYVQYFNNDSSDGIKESLIAQIDVLFNEFDINMHSLR